MRVVAPLLVVCPFSHFCLAVEPNSTGAEPYAGDIAADEIEMGAFTAVTAALRHHPALTVAICESRAAAGGVLQSGVRPNPEITIELENFAGSGTTRGFWAAKTKLQVNQLIELGDTRAKRVQLAGSDRDASITPRTTGTLSIGV